MFKATIHVDQNTDIAGEIDRLAVLSAVHLSEAHKQMILQREAEAVLADLKERGSECARHGIAIDVKRCLRTDDYEVTFSLEAAPARKASWVASLFGMR